MPWWFESPTHSDPRLGELRRSRGLWRGSIDIEGAPVPLAVSGPRAAPDPGALRVARSFAADFPAWRPEIAQALFEHYAPYAEAVAAGEDVPGPGGLPAIAGPGQVWPHAAIEFVKIAPLDGSLTVEIGYRVAWDEEHTLAARLRDGRLVELCGSVLPP